MVALALAAFALPAARQPAFAAEPAAGTAIPGVPPAEWPLISGRRAVRIADGTAAVREERRRHADLRSDTVTKPTDEMRRAMARTTSFSFSPAGESAPS